MKKPVTVNEDELGRLITGAEITALVEKASHLIAEDAQALAPRGAGRHGADSITYEMHTDDKGRPEGHVSWGRRFGFHMSFLEFGTSKTPARPFLRPAARKQRSL